jgi:hypothetical protein
VATQGSRTATLDRQQHFEMLSGEPVATPFDECLSRGADQIGHLQGRPRHLFRIAVVVALASQWENVERTGGGVEAVLREVEIDSGLFQIAMAQQNLYGP